jgi:hypothetical protein
VSSAFRHFLNDILTDLIVRLMFLDVTSSGPPVSARALANMLSVSNGQRWPPS